MKDTKHEMVELPVGQRHRTACACGWGGDALKNKRAAERQHGLHMRRTEGRGRGERRRKAGRRAGA